jgi:murein DD-endopeptidase MepM/ murein hydrolase activator NlpD
MLKKIEPFLRKYSWTVAAGIALIAVILFGVATCIQQRGEQTAEPEPEPLLMYDIPYERYELVEGEVEAGVSMGKLLERFGIGPGGTYRIEQAAKSDSVDITRIKAGQRYVAFMEPDTLSTDTIARPRLAHFAYEGSQTEYWVISLPTPDSIVVRKGAKSIRVERRHVKATIESSMYMAIVDNGLPPALAMEIEGIYGWSVDFFGLQKGDNFEIVYDQRYIDTMRMTSGGIGQIWGAKFYHGGKELYAIPFMQEGKIAYWDENGNSLKKQFLKAPLNSSRISSHFSGARRHPITRIIRPHNGVDYPAPTGTQVQVVANGTVTMRGWMGGGGGNSVIVKHARGYETRYLHLSRFGNISVGSRVTQGQIIGYVGSTGGSTGPHLHYEIRINGKATNPLKIPQEPGEPIKEANRSEFAVVRAKVMGELAGTLPEAEWLTRLDSIVIPDGPLPAVNPSPVDTTLNVIDGKR